MVGLQVIKCTYAAFPVAALERADYGAVWRVSAKDRPASQWPMDDDE